MHGCSHGGGHRDKRVAACVTVLGVRSTTDRDGMKAGGILFRVLGTVRTHPINGDGGVTHRQVRCRPFCFFFGSSPASASAVELDALRTAPPARGCVSRADEANRSLSNVNLIYCHHHRKTVRGYRHAASLRISSNSTPPFRAEEAAPRPPSICSCGRFPVQPRLDILEPPHTLGP